MTRELTDSTDLSVTVMLERSEQISSYSVNVDGARVGRADFIDSADAGKERIFFHTEVDEQFTGRGLAGALMRDALADSVREGVTVVPVCRLFARHLKQHGDDFLANGGAFRWPAPADLALVTRVAQGRP